MLADHLDNLNSSPVAEFCPQAYPTSSLATLKLRLPAAQRVHHLLHWCFSSVATSLNVSLCVNMYFCHLINFIVIFCNVQQLIVCVTHLWRYVGTRNKTVVAVSTCKSCSWCSFCYDHSISGYLLEPETSCRGT